MPPKTSKLMESKEVKIPRKVRLTDEDFYQGERLQNSPEAMLRLIDLIFGPGGWMDNIPS